MPMLSYLNAASRVDRQPGNMIDRQSEMLPCPNWLDVKCPHALISFLLVYSISGIQKQEFLFELIFYWPLLESEEN